jgi:diguanylate cyclase (GGDEF)-like protein
MKPRTHRLLSLFATALLALPVTSALLIARNDLEIDAEQRRAHAAVERLANALTDAVAQALTLASTTLAPRASGQLSPVTATTGATAAAPAWRLWRFADGRLSFTAKRSDGISERALIAELSKTPATPGVPALLGPFAGAAGADIVVVAVPLATESDAAQWVGASIQVVELVKACGILPLLRSGYRIEIADLGSQTAIYSSDYGKLSEAVTADVRLASAGWRVSLGSRSGWGVPLRTYPAAVLAVILALAWMIYDARRENAIASAEAERHLSEERRIELNQLYGAAVDQLVVAESRLSLLGSRDATTGLANRTTFLAAVAKTLEGIREQGTGRLCLFAIGFDRFDEIAHTFGREIWSRVVVLAAERVEESAPAASWIGRIGDAELALGATDTADPNGLAARILAALESPLPLDDQTFLLRPYVGLVDVTSAYESAETLLEQATAALVDAKREALSSYRVFDASRFDEGVQRVQLEVDLDTALKTDRLALFYEPIVEAVNDRVVGFEALLRWKHPTEGFIPPSRFLPIAIEAGFADRLDDWVMRHVAMQAASWDRAGYAFFIHFNLTADAFRRPSLPETVGGLLAEFHLSGARLCVELTESALIADLRGVARQLERIRQLGVDTWLDDFGTGYSALSYLRTLPLKGIKLDRSFLARVAVDSKDFGFLKSLLDLLTYLGLESIVEGVETRDQQELLALTNCHLLQGYLYSHAVPAVDAEKMLTAMPSKHAAALAS